MDDNLNSQTPVSQPEPIKPADAITITRQQWEEVQQMLQNHRAQLDFRASEGNSVTDAPDTEKPKNPLCRVWYVDSGKRGLRLVVGYGNSMQKLNERREPYLEMTVIDEDGYSYKVNFKEFRDGARSELVEILEQKIEHKKLNYGTVFKKEVDYSKYRSVETDQAVPLTALVQHVMLKVKLGEIGGGREVTLPQEAVN